MENIVKIIATEGYDDGYYWDKRFIFECNNKKYIHFDGGSGSGYYPCVGIIRYFEPNQEFLKDWKPEFVYDVGAKDDDYSWLAMYANKLDASGKDELVLWND